MKRPRSTVGAGERVATDVVVPKGIGGGVPTVGVRGGIFGAYGQRWSITVKLRAIIGREATHAYYWGELTSLFGVFGNFGGLVDDDGDFGGLFLFLERRVCCLAEDVVFSLGP